MWNCISMVIYFTSAAVAVDSRHMTASSSAVWSRFSPLSNFVNGHMSIIWFMVCHWSQSQEGDWARPNLCKLARHGPWPVRKRFINDHPWRGRSKPGCQIVGSVTIVLLTTQADDQSYFHCVAVSTDVMSDHIGRWDASHGGGCSETWEYIGHFRWASIIGSILSLTFTTLRRRCNITEHWQPWRLRGLQAAWNQTLWTMNLDVGEICVAGFSPHWTAVFHRIPKTGFCFINGSDDFTETGTETCLGFGKWITLWLYCYHTVTVAVGHWTSHLHFTPDR